MAIMRLYYVVYIYMCQQVSLGVPRIVNSAAAISAELRKALRSRNCMAPLGVYVMRHQANDITCPINHIISYHPINKQHPA